MAKFSLIIATYGRIDTVYRLFASIAMQPGHEIECILIDQNVDDRLSPLVEEWSSRFNIRVIRCDPHSTSARNLGIAASTGDIIAFPDDDCWFSPDLFSKVDDFFQRQSEYDLLSIGVTDGQGTPSGNRWVQKRCEISRLNIFRTSVTYSCFFRRCPAFETLRFDEKMGSRPDVIVVGAEDTDFVLSALNAGVRGFFDRTLLVFHPRKDMLSGNVRPDRAFHYGMGMGYVLRKYKMRVLWVSFIAYDITRAAFCLLSGRARPVRLCLIHARGIWKGYRTAEP
jgi:glycosyltransferase involved in cell wall biosynthesis